MMIERRTHICALSLATMPPCMTGVRLVIFTGRGNVENLAKIPTRFNLAVGAVIALRVCTKCAHTLSATAPLPLWANRADPTDSDSRLHHDLLSSDHLVRLEEDQWWDGEPERLSGLQVDRQLELHGSLHGQVIRPGTPQDLPRECGDTLSHIGSEFGGIAPIAFTGCLLRYCPERLIV